MTAGADWPEPGAPFEALSEAGEVNIGLPRPIYWETPHEHNLYRHPANGGNVQVNQALLGYLEANTRDTKYLIAVPSSMQGSDFVLATGRPVLYLGGFMGSDQVVTGDDLARMVAAGELRYIYWNKDGGNGFGGGGGSQGVPGLRPLDISAWVANSCMAIEDFDTVTQNAGAPDGTSGATNGRFRGPGGMQVTLYYCGS